MANEISRPTYCRQILEWTWGWLFGEAPYDELYPCRVRPGYAINDHIIILPLDANYADALGGQWQRWRPTQLT